MKAFDPLKKNNVRVLGNPDASRTLVFTHGFGGDQTFWRHVLPAFENDCRLVVYDLVGMGEADPQAYVQSSYLSLQAYAQDLIDLCAALELRDAVAVGHSMGSMIALLAAIRAPHLFSRLVLLGASPRYRDDVGYSGGLSAADIDAIYRGIHENYDAWARGLAAWAVGETNDPSAIEDFATALKRLPSDRALTIACVVLQSDCRVELDKVVQPTLIIQSTGDTFVPRAVAEYLHRTIRGSKLAFVEASGHLPRLTASTQVVSAIRAFL